jgi:hypothetical protein
MYTDKFKVVSVSTNTNSFGLYGVKILSKAGLCFEVGVGSIYKPALGDILNVALTDKNDLRGIEGINYEIPKRKPSPPQEVIDEVWSTDWHLNLTLAKKPEPVKLEQTEIRSSEDYKGMTPYMASAIAEGFCEGEDATEEQQLAAWQYLHDTGLAYQLQGWYGRNATSLIEQGLISK